MLTTAPAPVDPGQVATDFANGTGGVVVSTALDVWPALVPVLLALAVISAIAAKLGLKKRRSVV